MKKHPKMKALIIDDEVELAAMIAQRLKACGFDTAQAADGKTGYEQAVAWAPDVMLLDLSMPALDGWQLCQALAKNARTSSIPSIIMTAWATADLKRRARQAGAAAVVLKPFDEKNLVALVMTLARARRHHSHRRWTPLEKLS